MLSGPNPKFDEDAITIQDLIDALTPRELECLCIRCEQGLGLKEIGGVLGIKEFSVRNYFLKIFDKIGVRNPILLCQLYKVAQMRTDSETRVRIKGTRILSLDMNHKYRSIIVK